MTTDTDALTERIGRILNDEGWTFEGVHEPGEYDECEECRLTVDPVAVRVAREVAVEVRKAKAEALREAAKESETFYSIAGWEMEAVEVSELRARATEYETGDEHE